MIGRKWLSAVAVVALSQAAPALAEIEGAGGIPGIEYGSAQTFAEFHGFINLEYVDFEGADSTLDQHYFYFAAVARVRENVTVFGEIEYEHGGEEIKVDRAFIDLNLHRDYLNVRAGKFYAPFGLEIREYQSPVRRLVSRPLITRQFLFNEWVETGLNAYGNLLPDSPVAVTYDVAVVNGPGDNDGDGDSTPDIAQFKSGDRNALQNRDNNSSRTLIGRLGVPIRPIMTDVGVSWAGGKYSSTGSAEDLEWSQIGFDANFKLGGLDLRGEWVDRSTDVIESGDVTEIKGDGFYAQASYRHHLNLPNVNYVEPVVRFDSIEPDGDKDDDERTQLALGLNYSPWPHVVVRAEYQDTDEEPEKDNKGYLFQLVVDF